MFRLIQQYFKRHSQEIFLIGKRALVEWTPLVILGDPTYPLLACLMKPFVDHGATYRPTEDVKLFFELC